MRSALFAGLALAGLTAVGCATSTSTHNGGAVTVHTLRIAYNNAHLVVAGDEAVLIDAGTPADAAELEASIREHGVDPAALKAIIITHGHADHAGGALHFHERFQTPIIAGQGDQHMLHSGQNDRLCPTDGLAEDRLEEDQNLTYTTTPVDTWVSAPMPLTVGPASGQIIPLAGHTPGSLIVVIDDVALVGDLFRGAIVGDSATLHFYMCDLDDNRDDIRSALETLAPDAKVFLPGHFGPIERDDVRALVDDDDAWSRED